MAIDYDELMYTDEHVFVHDGLPFTGTAEERFPNGSVRCRFQFLDGKEHGVVEEYFSSGARKKCVPYLHGSVNGREFEWHESGAVKLEREVEFGIQISSREFDESGHLIKEYIRPDGDAMMDVVKARRRSESSHAT